MGVYIFNLDPSRRYRKIKYKHKSLDNFMIQTNKWRTDTVSSVADTAKHFEATHQPSHFLDLFLEVTKHASEDRITLLQRRIRAEHGRETCGEPLSPKQHLGVH